jgi:hypothetical protein
MGKDHIIKRRIRGVERVSSHGMYSKATGLSAQIELPKMQWWLSIEIDVTVEFFADFPLSSSRQKRGALKLRAEIIPISERSLST